MKKKMVWAVIAAVLLAGGAAAVFLPGPAQANPDEAEVAKLVAYLKDRHPRNLKAVALDALRRKSGAEAKLEELARGSDLYVAVAATTQLGKKGTAAAKSALFDLFEDGDLKANVRLSAMTAIAVGWKDEGDLDDLEETAAGRSELSARLAWLEEKVYGK